MKRDVLHINASAFPIGVERAIDSALRDRPVVIAVPNSPRSVVLTVSREAYLEGVIKGMAVQSAKKLCGRLKIIPPNEPLYRKASWSLFKFLSGYSPLIEPWRAGHFYVDLTGTRKLFGTPVDVGGRIQKEIKAKFSLRNTAGLASNKLVSRVASRVIRPRGLFDVFPGGEATFLSPLDVDVLPGIGTKNKTTLLDLNISLVGELAAIRPEHLFMAFGQISYRMSRFAKGIDDSPVRPPERTLMVREEETLAEDSNDDRVILGVLYLLVERATRRLRKSLWAAGAIKVEIIYSDHVSANREARLIEPSGLDGPIFDEARRILEKTWTRRTRLRYICITLKDVAPQNKPRQLSLFEHENDVSKNVSRIPEESQRDVSKGTENVRALASALDAIRTKYGEKSLRYGLTI